MVFNNTVAFCKGFYKKRSKKISKYWIDLAHCIHADGYLVATKADVARYCLHRMDDLLKDPLFKHDWMLRPSTLMDGINHHIDFARLYDEEITYEDATIRYFMELVVNMDKNEFSETLMPNDNVLPYDLTEAYRTYDGKYYPGEMRMDFVERVKNMLGDVREQEIDPKEYEKVECVLRIKNVEDVQPVLGSDNLNDCVEVRLTGNELAKGFINHNGKEIDIDLYLYRHCEFDMNASYTVRIKQNKWSIGDYVCDDEYDVMSIKKD